MKYLSISFFGVLGVLTRYFLGSFASKVFHSTFPWGTWIINLSGAFLIGIVFVLAQERNLISSNLRLGIMVGFLGGYTTFSSYCLESVRLIEKEEFLKFAIYLGGSPILGFFASFSAVYLTRIILEKF